MARPPPDERTRRAVEALEARLFPWGRGELLRRHAALGGTFPLADTPRSSPYAWPGPVWYNLADGVRAGDAACVELGVRFLEADLFASSSGYARARLARALKRAPLPDGQRRRLTARFWALLTRGERRVEWRELLALWKAIADEEDRARLRAFVDARPDVSGAFRARLVGAARDGREG